MSGFPYAPPAELIALLRSHDRFWLSTHAHADTDGFGSMLALGLALRAAGKSVVMADHADGPASLDHLPGRQLAVAADRLGEPPEVLLLLDCHGLDRIGHVAARLGGAERVAVIDHHHRQGPLPEGWVGWFVTEAAATCTLVQSLLLAMDELGLDRDRATALYAGLLTDTGGFRFANTTANALRAAAGLVEAGADPAELAEIFLHRRRPEALRLLARTLDSARYHLDGQVVLLSVRRDMLEETGGELTETEGFVNFFTSAEGVTLAALFKEDAPGRWRVSLRSNDHVDVHLIAAEFGGGGHRRAAGYSAAGELRALQEELLDRFVRALRERDASA